MEKKNRNKSLLIIFYRNPELGKVKTRLAATVGDEKALSIYVQLADHTRKITESLFADKSVYYSNFIDNKDLWPNDIFEKHLQHGNDLGEKMKRAFEEGFASGYTSVSIIGTDCFELNSQIINDAFIALNKNDVVLGPALDGGYYLLGMKKLNVNFFSKKNWSTHTVAADTIEDCKSLNLNYFLLPSLKDVDTEEDLPTELTHTHNWG